MALRLAAAKALWNVAHEAEAVVPALTKLLTAETPEAPEDAETRRKFLQTVIEALGRIGGPLVIQALLDAAESGNFFRPAAPRSLSGRCR